MATNQSGRDGAFHPTSPQSSGGAADSFKGTPDTRITAFSPEDGVTKSARIPRSIGVGGRDAGPIKFPMTSPASLDLSRAKEFYRENFHVDKDPFVSSTVPTGRSMQGLSPLAACFSPSANSIARGTTTDLSPYIKADDALPEDQSKEQPLDNRAASMNFVHSALSTDLGLSRCLVVVATGDVLHIDDIEKYISALQQHGYHFQGNKHLYCHGDRAYARFSNIRDACLFSQNASLSIKPLMIQYITPREYSHAIDPTSGLTAHEGQLTLAVFGPPSYYHFDMVQLQNAVQDVLAGEGDLFALKIQKGVVDGSLLNAVVEYCDNDVSLKAVSALNGDVVDGFHFCMTLYRPDIPSMPTVAHDEMVIPARTGATTSDILNDFQRLSLSRPQTAMSHASSNHGGALRGPYGLPGYPMQPAFGMMPVVYPGLPLSSPSYSFDHVASRSHGAIIPTGNYSLVGPVYPQHPSLMNPEYSIPRQFSSPRMDGRRQHAIRIARGPSHQVSGQHNIVDVNRIREGIDVRTTIMLRNIPNKVDQAMLKRIVDESSWGKYDFMYLRIDFANDCNVGYAFINFVDPLDIIDFVNARGNQRWNCFKSDKVAEISYATIQGKDCLVQKFRNSSVMLEQPHYRPKLYYTSNGPQPDLAGQEEPFPEPDNQSKMKRSCENAEHVGLFTPNAGQHFRDEQRRRRSQFDRGTRLAALEEFDFGSSFHQHQPYSLYGPQ